MHSAHVITAVCNK